MCYDISTSCKLLLETRVHEQLRILRKLEAFVTHHDTAQQEFNQAQAALAHKLQKFPNDAEVLRLVVDIGMAIFRHGLRVRSFHSQGRLITDGILLSLSVFT